MWAIRLGKANRILGNRMSNRKKRKKRISRYKGIKIPTGNIIAVDETPIILRKAFPKELVDSFVTVCLSDWTDKTYKIYEVQAKAFLGKKYEDKIESGTLVVKLSKACYDLTEMHKQAKNLAMKTTCESHPKYRSMRTPRSECKRCWSIYNGKKTKKEKAKKKATNKIRAST